jgi:16S rRNA (adenine1518-N6/adenine1519-N6)-dimethyltransferase
MPRPTVGSAVINLTLHKESPFEVRDEKLLFRMIRASFNQRRKTLMNGLNNSPELPFTKEEVGQALTALGISENIRGEALTLGQFAALSNQLSKK